MKYLIFALLVLLSFVAEAQTYPTGFPSQFNTGWFKWGYPQADSGLIFARRDTNWLPRFTGTFVVRPQDRRPYFYDSTDLRWYKLLIEGDVSGSSNVNIGSGFRWAIPNTNNIKTVFNSNTIIWDSTSNTNGLTAKADTTVLATQYDLNEITISRSIYVAQNGLSSGQGLTPATAVNMDRLVTLSASFLGGEKILLKANDTLRGSLNLKSNSIVTRYDTGSAPIIAGTIRSTSLTWSQDGAVWKAYYPINRIARVLLNGIPERNAQSGYYTVTSRPNTTQITASGATGLGTWVTNAEMVSKEFQFRFKYNTITAYSSGTGTFTVNEANGIIANYQFKLINNPNLISADGDWAYTDDTIYYRSPGNVNPNTLNVELSAYDVGIKFEFGGSNFIIDGVTLYAQAIYGIHTNYANNIRISNSNFYKQFDAGLYIDTSHNIVVNSCNFDSIGSTGIFASVNVDQYVFSDLSIEHIGMGTEPPYSRQAAPQNGNNGYGIIVLPNSDNGLVEKCRIDSTSYIGIRTDGSNTTVQKNEVSNYLMRQNDGGGIYMWSNEAVYGSIFGWLRIRNNKVLNNLCYNGFGTNEGGPVSESAAMGVYLDNGTYDTYVAGNTCYNNTSSGIYTGWDTRNNQITGNVCYNNSEAGIRIASNTDDGLPVTTEIKISNNILVQLNSTQLGIRIHDQQAGFNPFDNGGYCEKNIFISPYTDTVIQNVINVFDETDYTLAAAQSALSQTLGKQDVYSTPYIDTATALVQVPIDVNAAIGSRRSVTPDSCRSPINRDYDVVLGAFESAVYVKDTLVTGGGGSGGGESLQATMDIGNTTNLSVNFTSAGTNRNSFFGPYAIIDDFPGLQMYPSSGTNAGAALSIIPKGTGYNSTIKGNIFVYNTDYNADATNYEFGGLRSGGTNGYGIISVASGTGIARQIFINATGSQTPAAANVIFNTSGESQFGSTSDIGTGKVQITGTLQQQDGNQGSGKILTSDADGVGTWQTPAASSQTLQQVLTTGSTLTTNNTIANGTNQLDITGSRNFVDGYTFGVTNTTGTVGVAIKGIAADGRGVWGEVTSGSAVYGNATSGFGLAGFATTGNAIYAQSDDGVSLEAAIQPSSTNTAVPISSWTRTSTGTATNGIGVYNGYFIETSDGTSQEALRFGTTWTNATTASRTSQAFIALVNNAAAVTTVATFDANGNATFGTTNSIVGTATNNDAVAGNLGEEVNSTVSTYTNYTTTATYQNITSITLTAGDWDLSAFFTFSANGATLTAATDALFVISTTTASAAGATEGKNISYVTQAAPARLSGSITPYRVNLSATTTYYLNSQSTFTLGNPQYVGGLRARRAR